MKDIKYSKKRSNCVKIYLRMNVAADISKVTSKEFGNLENVLLSNVFN